MKDTKIPWCDHTFNPWVGCEPVSEGCEHCYAKAMHERWNGKGSFARRRVTSEANWRMPVRWNREARECGKRVRVFCGSMCDWLDSKVPDEYVTGLLLAIATTPWIDWLLLTKRPQNFKGMIERQAGLTQPVESGVMALNWSEGKPPDNVWFGVTAENQARWDERVSVLRKIPARVKWVSCEPLLGMINPREPNYLKSAGWIVAGGENGPGARPCEKRWILSLWCDTRNVGRKTERDALESVPFFFKQAGKNSVNGIPSVWFDLAEQTREWPDER